jgi:hypothetical protein
MQDAFGANPGALHEALGVPPGENIPAGKLKVKTTDSPKMRKRKALAKLGAKISRSSAKKRKK